jgi:hypothetical protein
MVPRASPVVSPPPILRPDWGNSSATCFQVKQAGRSWRVSHAVLPPLVLWRNWQTEVCLVLRPKPKNRRGDFEAQITKLKLPILRPKLGNPSRWFWGQTRENRRHRFYGQTGENCLNGFEVKPLINRRHWFWGSIKKPVLLVSMWTVQTAHNATWPLDHPTTEYPTCATIPGPLHQVSYSCHDPRRCTPCHTGHLHTTR